MIQVGPKGVAAKAAKPQRSVAKSSARKPTNAAAKGLPAHYAIPKSEGDGAALWRAARRVTEC
jgi:hypothetical protein